MDAGVATPPRTTAAVRAAGRWAVLLLALVAVRPVRAADPGFEAHWQDGRAELNGYRYTVTRYGHPRVGRAVAIYVTEPFSRSKRVKLEEPTRSPEDAVEVLKLNLVRDFQTGIYDYHTMVSLFAATADFSPLKLAFVGAEWCGQVYEELNVTKAGLSQRLSSYFEGESAERSLPRPAGGMMEDELFILLRGLRTPYLAPGERRTAPFLPSPFYRRLVHQPAAWESVTIERLARPETVVVPAGRFDADVYVVRPDDGREGRFYVERAHPHRIAKWTWAPAAPGGRREARESAELTGSDRLAYWRLNGPGGGAYRERIGIGPDTR